MNYIDKIKTLAALFQHPVRFIYLARYGQNTDNIGALMQTQQYQEKLNPIDSLTHHGARPVPVLEDLK